mgnify:CR=1 FL=1
MIDSENISCIEKDETINNISFFPLEKKERTKSQEKKTKRKKEGKKWDWLRLLLAYLILLLRIAFCAFLSILKSNNHRSNKGWRCIKRNTERERRERNKKETKSFTKKKLIVPEFSHSLILPYVFFIISHEF